MQKLLSRHPAIPYIAPFIAFIVLLGLKNSLPFGAKWEYPARVVIVVGVVIAASLPVISWRLVRPLSSIAMGLLVFAIWIAPDLLWPAYRNHWLFQNSLLGTVSTSLPTELQGDWIFLAFRLFGTAILVPIVEELFWRGWLLRYIVNSDFQKIGLGVYTTGAMWLTAALFATEHGPFWDVGLIAGLLYNWWLSKTRNLTDCILAHGVTNAALAAYVISFGQWQYWL